MSRLLVDSHTFLWFVGDAPRLPTSVKATLEDEDAILFLSAASAFEIAIKHGLGKLPLDVSLQVLLGGSLIENGIDLLSIEPRHLVAYASLPFPASGHRDPFDRILVAQAQVDGLRLVSGEVALDAYGIDRVWS